jgi:serine/threonine protein kinase/Tfp pilus assembly protein PilF
MPDDSELIRDILDQAREYTPEQRKEYLDRACGGNAELRREVESLLAALENDREILGSPTLPAPELHSSVSEGVGAHIGRYKILEPIGEGGYGTVFMAEQTSPVQRKVALKIIKAGMDTKQVIARFEAERQALALMDHPNIAKVFDGGATNTGRPYFVMELVRGVPITRYCDEHRVEPRQRLDLFMQICQAVQHAHQKGIIHRDLKPSNVLVALYDGKPVPKVIDFGIAKATGQKLTEATMFTGFGDVIGTLEYMSPEQAELNQLDVDTRSDIYSLGVLLYELLTGSTPLPKERIKNTALLEALKFIREEEPPMPSIRLSASAGLPSIAASRGLQPKTLSGMVHGELDWIVMKALEKDRNRRYETANGFAADVQCYLDDEAVQACPPSKAYRWRKLARRHRGVLRIAAAFVSLLLATAAISTWQAVRATRAEREAARQRDQAVLEKKRADEQTSIAEAVREFLNKDLLRQADAFGRAANLNPNPTVREALDRAAGQIGGRFKDQPLVEAAIRLTIGDTYTELGESKKAIEHLTATWEIRKRILGFEAPDTLESIGHLAYAYANAAQADKGKALLMPIFEQHQQRFGEGDKSLLPILDGLASVYLLNGEMTKAEPLFRRLIEMATRAGKESSAIENARSGLAFVLTTTGRLKEAEPLLLTQLEVARNTYGEQHVMTANAEYMLAANYRSQKRFDSAIALQLQAIATFRQVLGDMDRNTTESVYTLAWMYRNANQHQEADRYFTEALDLSRKAFGEAEPAWLNDVAYIKFHDGKYSEAEQLYLRVLTGWRKRLGDGNPNIVRAVARLGLVMRMQRKNQEADAYLKQAIELGRNMKGENLLASGAMLTVAMVMKEDNRLAEAEEFFGRQLKMLEASHGPNYPDVAECYANLAALALRQQHYAQAEHRSRQALSTREHFDAPDWRGAGAQAVLGEVLIEQGKLDEAERVLSVAYTQLKPGPAGKIEPEQRKAIEQAFVRLYDRWQKPEKAAAWKAKLSTSQPTTATTHPLQIEEP